MVADRASDEALAKLAREGDTKAFEELFERYKSPILNFIYRLIGNRETAEEVTQEAFIRAYKSLGIFDPRKRFSAWIYTIARNLAKNALRDKKYFRDVSLEKAISGEGEDIKLKHVLSDPNPRPDEIALDEELSRNVQAVLKKLPAELREVITLCNIEQMTYKEASKILGVSEATVMNRLRKAKLIFMKELGIDTKSFGRDKNE
ncbi:MAG: sigma-70 family RNA polymerase sigma factor [Candidatus Omnitrophica bacterium]|nr:sigma-70 family RNA polymerase sigma factor [Candidatus Omnitrophota bacterium]